MSFVEGDFSAPVQIDLNTIRAQGFGMVQFDHGDQGMVVNFRWESVRNAARSREVGRPFHDRKIFVTIHPPGERLNIIDREVVDSDKYRWPRQWNSFCANKVHVPEGTPVSMLFPANPEIAGNLEGWGIYTVEQLANLSAAGIDSIGMGAQEWVNRSKRYIADASKGVSHHHFEEMKRQHDSKVRTLENTIADLNNRVGKLMDIVNNQPVHVTRQVHDAGIHDPYPYSAPANGGAPRRPGYVSVEPVPGAPSDQFAPSPSIVPDAEPVQFSSFVGAAQKPQFVEPPAGFVSPQEQVINANHPAAAPRGRGRPRKQA